MCRSEIEVLCYGCDGDIDFIQRFEVPERIFPIAGKTIQLVKKYGLKQKRGLLLMSLKWGIFERRWQ